MPEQTFEPIDGFALDHVRGGAVAECKVGFSTLPAAKLVADLDLLYDPGIDHVDIRTARLRSSAMVIVRRHVVACVGREERAANGQLEDGPPHPVSAACRLQEPTGRHRHDRLLRTST
jgi:hypothetical protein